MATIGQALTAPEAGWRRYDDTDPNIQYSIIGDGAPWTNGNNTSYYNGSFAFLNSNSNGIIRFNFTGNKIRLISYALSSAYSDDMSISIDGVNFKYTLTFPNNKYQALVFEKTDLNDGEHSVEIRNNQYATTRANLDAVDIDINGQLLMFAVKKVLFRDSQSYKYYSTIESKFIIIGSSVTEETYISLGVSDLSVISEQAWATLIGNVELLYYTDNTSIAEIQISIETNPFTLAEELGSTFSIVEYTDSPTQEQSIITTETELFSVYDHISETPEVLVYTELNDDITVETTTEPFDIYDEFGEEVEVLYYTDDASVNEADLILEANWSPIDELKGDFEVVTWTDEPQDSAQRVLEMVAIPKPQFIKLANPKKLYGYLDEVVAKDISKSYRDEARYLFSNKDGNVWYVWDFKLKEFVVADTSTHSEILKNGMKWNELKSLSTDDWRTWEQSYMNIGIFLKDNPRDTITSIVDSISYKDYLPRNSVEVEKANFYILNTTARIDLNIVGNTVEGVLSDDDLTRVQYRILLNGLPYYPVSGSFTELSTPPQNINLTINSNDIAIDDWNTVKVEFRDFFGTIDFWQTSFIGTYSGLMFKDVHGDYYSNEIGEVLKYLDFGTIIAGQTTIEHEIILKNQYGYDVKNVHVYGNSSNFPNGMSLQFSKSLSPFTSDKDLLYTETLDNDKELSFYVRISTVLGATPNANGSFDIIVRADKA